MEIELNSHGVRFGNITYPYKQLKYFWVVHNERHQTINFHTSALLNSVLILELEDQDPEEAREFIFCNISPNTPKPKKRQYKKLCKIKILRILKHFLTL